MPARIKFAGRYGNGLAAFLGVLVAIIAIDQGQILLPLVSAVLIAAAALSIYVAEKAAFEASQDDWQRAERREIELRRRLPLQTHVTDI